MEGSVYRIRECASEFLSLEDDLVADDDDEGSWELMGRDLSLKSTFLYCDLNRVISSSRDDDRKKTLTGLANRLFCFMEELGEAVKSRSIAMAQLHYNDTAVALQEVMAALIHTPLD